MIKIAIDAMGGDHAPQMVVEGAMRAIKNFDDIALTLYGDEQKIRSFLSDETRITVVHTDQVVSMDEKAAIQKMRRDKESSMAMGLLSVKEKENQAFVTAGPTGPYVAGAHMILKRIPGMKRTALAPIFPKKDGYVMLMDVGANIETKAEHLVQYAEAATVYAKEILNVEDPKVGLANNGSEEGKGRSLEKEAFELLENNQKIHFIGNVEAKEFFKTEATILVTDGFTGNNILKSIEGTLKQFSYVLKREIASSIGGKIGYLFMRKNLKRVAKEFDIADIGGAILLGVTAPAIKAHGSSNSLEYSNAIKQARNIVMKDVVPQIEHALKED